MKKLFNLQTGEETIVPLTVEEQAEIDARDAELAYQATPEGIDAAKTAEADIEQRFDPTLRAFALVMLDEINTLRTNAGLQPRTVAQLKNAVKNRL